MATNPSLLALRNLAFPWQNDPNGLDLGGYAQRMSLPDLNGPDSSAFDPTSAANLGARSRFYGNLQLDPETGTPINKTKKGSSGE